MIRYQFFGVKRSDLILDISIVYLASTTTATPTTTTATPTTTTTIPTTTITTPTYCAASCTGNYTSYTNATTCGRVCVDTGSYQCQPSSTICAGGTFSDYGYCDGVSCSAGCCVYDNHPGNPYAYLCISCHSAG